MKVLPFLFASLALGLGANAQYFSEGWKPGQPVTREAYPTGIRTPVHQPQATPTSEASQFKLTDLLTSGPVGSLMNKAGINITEKLEKAKAEAEVEIWDTRIPLITDDSYDELIVNESLTPEEEAERVWFIIITASKGGKNVFSLKTDEEFDEAYNRTLIEGDLPNVRWARMDYLNVTYITTKWAIWQAPYFVVATNRGHDLRFYKANSVKVDSDVMREFLREEGWRANEPWTGPLAPGGDLEHVMHYFGVTLKQIYEFLLIFPRWLLMIASGIVGNMVLKFLHSNKSVKSPAKPAASLSATMTKTEVAATPAQANGTPTRGKAKQRKNAKK
ncbi:uncharacterized protein FIBRA_03810 [Fibroporia radiculosa]|uniref:Thioredoxin-like fold domain-containing protein n=1 Tax=Fibroporia radiculosa TaxID=599839 RepID=J4H2L7_9APHY|nr:uncharacterized protein FIBRA_03810 [Fibroporia radiculosa]CCM01744.1 predicted protein [Fibroporia radiculosa]